jgi:TPR repeat protein
MYTCGEGVPLDLRKAIEWELKAVALGEVSGLLNVGISYRLTGDLTKAQYWFERSLAAGDGCGALELAKLYRAKGSEPDKVKQYLRLAIANRPMCEADIEEAEEMLAEMEAKR